MASLLASQPLEALAVDFTVLEPAIKGRENVLVMTDVFTKFTHAVATRDQKATTPAKVRMVSSLRSSEKDSFPTNPYRS